MAAVSYYKNKCYAACRKCYACCVKGAPPVPCEDVLDLFEVLGVQEKHSQQIYSVFHELRQSEEEHVVKIATELDVTTCLNILDKRRRWIEPLLKRLLELGGVEEDMVTWDNFLYIFLRFCSLSRVELCQCLFMIIGLEVETETPHYLKMTDLETFYKFYAKSPVHSFNTRLVDFSKFPHKRYYVNDFAELCQRFTQLMNPIIHLQRHLQEKLPSVEFWDSYDRTEVFVHKITFEFFRMEKTRIHLRGEPPFRESCLMLAPESLGGEPINHEQWNNRTYGSHERTAALNEGAGVGPDGRMPAPGYQYRSLKQNSVWGEHPLPEEMKVLHKIAVAKRRAKEEKKEKKTNLLWSSGMTATPLPGQADPVGGPKQPGHDTAQAHGEMKSIGDKPADSKVGQPLALMPPPKTATAGLAIGRPITNQGIRQGGKKGTSTAPAHLDAMPEGMDVFVDNPSELAHFAAALNEDLAPPIDLLPPTWMRNFTVAPAPRVLGPDPPLEPENEMRRTFGNTFGTTNGFSASRVKWADQQK
mmetsp:Transcript_72428/g.125565  ORF Transcript_72428/g.125565 Transcript_72428/m.125565 type:complete len:529 (+) Transcript_72428:132-1718(+)